MKNSKAPVYTESQLRNFVAKLEFEAAQLRARKNELEHKITSLMAKHLHDESNIDSVTITFKSQDRV